jgi:O-antigen/teichoic acid export membrane protein
MTKTLESRTLNSTLAGGLSFLFSLIQNIILVPLILKYWGAEKYGLWISLFAFASLLKTLDLGHQNYVGNEFNKAYFNDINLAKKILGSGFFVAILLGFLEIFVYYFFGWNIIEPKEVGLGDDIVKNIELRYSFLVFIIVWGITGSVGGLLVRIILPLGLYAKTAIFSLIYKFGEIAILLFAVLSNLDLSYLFILYAFINLIYNSFLFYYIKTMMPFYFPWWQSVNFKLGVRNFSNSLILTSNGFIEQFNSSGIVLLVSKLLGVLFIPVFTTIRTVTNVVLQITNLVTNPLAPELIRYHISGDNRKIGLILNTNWFIAGLLVNLPFLLVSPFLGLLYDIWVKNSLPFNPKLYYLLTLSVSFVNFGRSYITYLSGINSLKSLFMITITRFILTIGLSFLLIPIFKLNGIGMAILIAEFFSSFLLPILLVNYEMDKSFIFKLDVFQISGLFQVIVLYLFYFSIGFQSYWSNLIFGVCIFLMLGISFFQWRKLDIEVRLRFKSLFLMILRR